MNEKTTMFESLQKIQQEIPIIGKNKKGFNYKYADIEKIWDSIREIISRNGFVITNPIEQEGVRTIAMHESGEKLESFVPFSKVELKPQDKGSEITYYRRYNLTAIFNIVIADEDNDGKIPQNDLKPSEVDVQPAIKKLQSAQNLSELQILWKGLNAAERGNSKVVDVKDEMKALLK